MTRRIALIGRSRSCKVRLNDDSVSTVHCSLVRTPKGVWAVDLLGRGGIAVNGVPVRLARLEAGDQLRVGEFLLRCRYSQPLRSLPGKGLVAPSHPVAGLAVPSAGPSDLLTVPGGSAVVPSPAGDAVARALLLPLLNQLANVQMQMFDQFQQALAMVLQTLGAWHSDQVGLIGRELRQLREMTGELQSLRLQLAQQRPEGRDAAPSPGVQSIAGPSRTGGEGDLSTPGVCPAPVPQPADPGPRPAGEAVAAGPSPADAHDWLYQRVASLERERQSTWQRILGFLFKGEAGARPP